MTPRVLKKNVLSQQGFTLIEVMVALVIFLIAIIGCYTLQMNSSLSNTRSNSRTTASTWAQYWAEDLLARQYTSYYTDPLLLNNHGNATVVAHLDNATKATADGVVYVGTDDSISVNPAVVPVHLYVIYWNIVDNRPLNNIKQIRIIVNKDSGLNAGQLYTQDYFKLGPI